MYFYTKYFDLINVVLYIYAFNEHIFIGIKIYKTYKKIYINVSTKQLLNVY